MTRGDALRDRTAAAIVERAATVLAERGDAASMEEIASAAGVGRATLYRYFPTRERLLAAMATASIAELVARIEDADLRAVGFDEAIARLARAIIATGRRYLYVSQDTLAHGGRRADLEVGVIAPIRDLLRRGVADGAVRPELDLDLTIDLFSGLVRGALGRGSSERGVEELSAAVAAVFLRGVSAS